MSDKEKIESLKPLDPAKYENIDLDHLAIYAVSQLDNIGVDLSFENAAVAAYKLFPKKFSLLGYPEYPATKRVHDCLFRCTFKTKRWLGGKTAQGYVITDRSRIFIKEAEDLLSVPSAKKTKATSQTRRKEVLLAEVVVSPAYIKYVNKQGESISRSEFCYLLQGTLDSARQLLKENLLSLKKFSQELKRQDISEFLDWLEVHFKKWLLDNSD
jgi:hypothetical protein